VFCVGLPAERHNKRERERENLFDGSFSEFQKDGKKRGEIKMNFSKKDTSQEEETKYIYPAAMSNLHVCICDDLFSFFTMM
jgi:hypothetical protein